MIPIRMGSSCLGVLAIMLSMGGVLRAEPRPCTEPPLTTGEDAPSGGKSLEGERARAGEPDAREEGGGERDRRGQHPRDEEREERAFLKGSAPGALGRPIALDTEMRVAKLCSDLETPSRAATSGDAFERGLARHERRLRRREALRAVYSVIIEPARFEVDDYRYSEQRLPLRLDRQLIALDGALTLAIVQRERTAFEIVPGRAREIAGKIAEKRAALRIVFRVESEAGPPNSCFSYPKSAAYALRTTPLAFEIVDDKGDVVASAKTDALARLEAFLNPGPGSIVIAVENAEEVDGREALMGALEKKMGALESCFEPVLSSDSDTALLSFRATWVPSGALGDTHLEMAAIEDGDSIVSCVERVLSTITTPKVARASEVHVSIGVAREHEKPSEDSN